MDIAVNRENEWRLQTPGTAGWARSARPDAARKYFMISADAHLNCPPDIFTSRIDRKHHHRLPRIETDGDGKRWYVSEGARRARVIDVPMEGEDAYRARAGTVADRLRDQARDGIDGELIFPNGPALALWRTPDPTFSHELCRAYNDWAWEATSAHKDRLNVAAPISPGHLDGALDEVKRVAKLGFRVLTLPCQPFFGPEDGSKLHYNRPHFDPLWALIEETGMPVTFHVATTRDPRTTRGEGGALINSVAHSTIPTMEPVVHLCSAGVLERFPGLRFATVEAGCGWVPWLLNLMDELYRKQHFWQQPRLRHLPSDYYRRQGASTFQEDPAAMALVEGFNLTDNFMWANDYPHHEGTWPHSAAAIERMMGNLREESRAKILGLNAARMFGFAVPPGHAAS